MNIDRSVAEALLKKETENFMTTVNHASLPFRALNVVVGGLIHLAASTHPVAKEAIGKLGQMIHESWHNSAIGKTWETTRVDIINDFQKLSIPREDTSYFLDSVEEIVLAGGTLTIGTLAKSAFKTARHLTAQIKGKNSGYPVIEDIYFKPTTGSETIYEHSFAANTAAEGFIDYRYVRGTQNSILIYLEYIQKGKVYDWNVNSSQIKGHTPYSSSQAGISAIKEIGEKLGSDRVFLQFEPLNPKFRAFVEKRYPSKGEHPIRDSFCPEEISGPYPVFELTSPCEGTTQKILRLMSPFEVSETLRVLSSESYIEPNFLSFSLISPVRAYGEVPNISQHVEDTSQVSDTGLEMALSYPEDTLSSLGQHILEFTGQITGVTPAQEELRRLNEIVQCLAKNPQQAPLKVVSELLRQPESVIRNILNNPEGIIKNAEQFLHNPAANYMGALAAVGTILTFMDSVSWVCEFMQKPGRTVRELVKMPYTCVKGVVELGIALIRHPEKATKQLFKSLIKAPEITVKRFLRSVGLKKRKKKRHTAPEMEVNIDPVEQMRIAQKYADDLMALYSLARSKWLIDPYKTIEEYHCDLLKDWNCLFASQICQGNYFNFPRFLAEKFEQDDFLAIRTYSPWAHYSEPIAPPEVILCSFLEGSLAMAKVEASSAALAISHRVHITATNKLNLEREQLKKTTNDLHSFLNANHDELKRKLELKMKK